MTLAQIKQVIDQYLAVDQPPANLAEREIRDWLRVMQVNGEVWAFSVRRRPVAHRSTNLMIVVDVQTTRTSSTHTLHFVESQWMNIGRNQATSPAPAPVPVRNDPPVEKKHTPKEQIDSDYERAMGILL